MAASEVSTVGDRTGRNEREALLDIAGGSSLSDMSTETTKRLTARQRARKALQRDQETQKRREQALAAVLDGLDERDKISARIGTALGDLIDLGDNRTSAGELAGLTAREVTGFLRATEDADATEDTSTPGNESAPETDDTSADTGAGSVVSASEDETAPVS